MMRNSHILYTLKYRIILYNTHITNIAYSVGYRAQSPLMHRTFSENTQALQFSMSLSLRLMVECVSFHTRTHTHTYCHVHI